MLESELKQISKFFEKFKETNNQLTNSELEKRHLYKKIDALEENVAKEYQNNLELERRNSDLKKIIEDIQLEKLLQQSQFSSQQAKDILNTGLFNPSKTDLSYEDLTSGIKVRFLIYTYFLPTIQCTLEETISTCLSLKNLSNSQNNSNLLDITKFLTDSIKSLQIENKNLISSLNYYKSQLTYLQQKITFFGLNRRTVYSYLKKTIKNSNLDLNTKETLQYILDFIKESYK